MKKVAIISACILASLGASAQLTLLKTAEKQFGSAKTYADYQAAVQAITPAFTDAETANLAQTYYIPGQNGIRLYDDIYKASLFGNEVDKEGMSNALMDGYNYLLKALPLDSVTDPKGKLKTKYSKDIIKNLAGHVNDFDRAAVTYWGLKQWNKAYDAWEACLMINSDPRFAKAAGLQQLPDSAKANLANNQGLAAYQMQDWDKALASFERSIALGTNSADTYEFAYSAAYNAKNQDKMKSLARAGLNKFGTSDPRFLEWTVNGYINDKNYAEAAKMLDEAIAVDPDNAGYYFSYGVVNQTQGKNAEAKESYKKAIALDSKQAQACRNLGQIILEEYDALDQAAGNMSAAEYGKYRQTTLFPMLREAAGYLENAYEVNDQLRDSLLYLRNIYYVLEDADNLHRIEDLLKY